MGRTLVFAHGKWHICIAEINRLGRTTWVYAESRAFCCYVEDNPPTHPLPPKPKL